MPHEPDIIEAYLVKANSIQPVEAYDDLAGYDLLKEEFSIQPFRQLVIPGIAVIGHITHHGATHYLHEEFIFCTRAKEDIEEYMRYIRKELLDVVRTDEIPSEDLETFLERKYEIPLRI